MFSILFVCDNCHRNDPLYLDGLFFSWSINGLSNTTHSHTWRHILLIQLILFVFVLSQIYNFINMAVIIKQWNTWNIFISCTLTYIWHVIPDPFVFCCLLFVLLARPYNSIFRCCSGPENRLRLTLHLFRVAFYLSSSSSLSPSLFFTLIMTSSRITLYPSLSMSYRSYITPKRSISHVVVASGDLYGRWSIRRCWECGVCLSLNQTVAMRIVRIYSINIRFR